MKTIRGYLPSSETNPSPEIECYYPKENSNGVGLIIFPGGGYYQLMAHEGKGYAEFFTKHGFTCFVVTYRLGPDGHKHPAMLEDALSAIYTVRSQAKELRIDPHKIGVVGSSAGGHLAASSMTLWDFYECRLSLRPDFGVLCYSVITSEGPFVEKGSFGHLLGENPDPDLYTLVSCEKQVTANTPPCFLWSTGEDVVVPVENSLLFAASLSRHKIPYDLRIYDLGIHGLGLETEYGWEHDCVKWINRQILDS